MKNLMRQQMHGCLLKAVYAIGISAGQPTLFGRGIRNSCPVIEGRRKLYCWIDVRVDPILGCESARPWRKPTRIFRHTLNYSIAGVWSELDPLQPRQIVGFEFSFDEFNCFRYTNFICNHDSIIPNALFEK